MTQARRYKLAHGITKRSPVGVRMSGYQFDVFISYTRGGQTEDFIKRLLRDRLARALNDRLTHDCPGGRVFFDLHSTASGGEAEDRICGGLRRSAVMLALLNERYGGRPWCLREARSFLLREQAIGWTGTDPQAPALLVPVVVGELNPDSLPPDLRGLLRKHDWSRHIQENDERPKPTRALLTAVDALAADPARGVRAAPPPQDWPIAPLPSRKNPAGPRPIGAP